MRAKELEATGGSKALEHGDGNTAEKLQRFREASPAVRQAQAVKRRINRGSLLANLSHIEIVVEIDNYACRYGCHDLHRIGKNVIEKLELLQIRVALGKQTKSVKGDLDRTIVAVTEWWRKTMPSGALKVIDCKQCLKDHGKGENEWRRGLCPLALCYFLCVMQLHPIEDLMHTDGAEPKRSVGVPEHDLPSTSKSGDVMTRVIVIGATGHVGTYLVPALVEAGHEVVAISRGVAEPYQPHTAWRHVERLQMDREALERAGIFGENIRSLKPDIVIDMICFTKHSAEMLVDALSGHVGHFLHTGTIWTHGASVAVPTAEDAPKHPFGDYGVQKAEVEAYLLMKAHVERFPVTILHPGHIVGPGWVPLNPQGNFNPQVFSILARGGKLVVPNFGFETVHHVHAEDVARLFMAAISSRTTAIGEAFHAVSDKALTLRGYAESMSRWFGHEPELEFLPYDQWAAGQNAEDAKATWEHIARSPNCSMEKARRLLGFVPRHTSLQAVQEAVTWLIAKDEVDISVG